jgi:hypothetical protein
MAAHTQFPPTGTEAQVRGDPATMVVRFRVNGIEQNITTWTFRSYVRDRIDGTKITECSDFTVATPASLPDVFPAPGSTVPCVLVMRWTPAQTAAWATGFVADVEQLLPDKRTWVIFDSFRMDPDVSNEPGSP